MFHLRAEYLEYLSDCKRSGITVYTFREWFDTVYWYEMQDCN